MSASCFEISEVDIKTFSGAIAHMWKIMADGTKLLAQGKEWNTFFKVCNSLTLMITRNSLTQVCNSFIHVTYNFISQFLSQFSSVLLHGQSNF